MSKYANIEQIKEVIRTEWVRYMPMELDISLSFVLGKISEVPTIEVSEDSISREWLLNYTHAEDVGTPDEMWKPAREWVNAIKNAPSVVPSRAEGEWKRICPAHIYECSACGGIVITQEIECYKYCHQCGAKMTGEEK